MKIYIIRHGDPDYEKDSLTEKGFREAEYLSQKIVKTKIDDFYCSPLGRAQATAKPSMEKLHRTYEVLPWLREFAGYVVSPHTGEHRLCWDFAPSDWADEEKHYLPDKCFDTPLMHSGNVAEIYEESRQGLDALLKKYGIVREGRHFISTQPEKEDCSIALFCHCIMGLTIVSHLTGVAPVVLWHNFFLPTSSVSTIVTEKDQYGKIHFRCAQLGDTSHLYINNEPISEAGLYPYANFKR